jgi:hypothetical protein
MASAGGGTPQSDNVAHALAGAGWFLIPALFVSIVVRPLLTNVALGIAGGGLLSTALT